MARIFNIYFTYKDVTFHAVVSVRNTPFFTEYTLNNIQEDLLCLLPGNKIVSRLPGELFFQHTSVLHASPLMKNIINAVKEHEHTLEA